MLAHLSKYRDIQLTQDSATCLVMSTYFLHKVEHLQEAHSKLLTIF